jgi:hypothetical protein
MNTQPNREAWLTSLARLMAPKFTELGLPLPAYRVSCSWPTRKALASRSGRVIWQCFAPECSKAGVAEVFVSPVLEDAMRVAGTLAHELAHAAVGVEYKHGAPFARLARALGLEGKPTATVEGEEFVRWVTPLLAEVGAYPHAAVDLSKMPAKKQTCRQLKVSCPECGYTARTTRKWLETRGAPLCPCNAEPMVPEDGGEGGEGDGDGDGDD